MDIWKSALAVHLSASPEAVIWHAGLLWLKQQSSFKVISIHTTAVGHQVTPGFGFFDTAKVLAGTPDHFERRENFVKMYK